MLFHVLLHSILNNKSILLFEDSIQTDGSMSMDLQLFKIRGQTASSIFPSLFICVNTSLWVQKQPTTSYLTVMFFELSGSMLFLNYQLNKNFTPYASKHFSENVFILWELITKLLFILYLREKWSDILFLAFKNKCRFFSFERQKHIAIF